MCRSAERKSLGNRAVNREQMTNRVGEHITENTGHNNRGHGDGRIAAELLHHAHTDCRRDGLRQQRDVLHMVHMKYRAEHENRTEAREHTGQDAEHDRKQIVLQKLQLLVERHGERHRRRCQKIA